MTNDGSLPPPGGRFPGERPAGGRFQPDRQDVPPTLRRPGEDPHAQDPVHTWLKQELDKGLSSRPGEPVTRAFWDHLRDRVRAATASGRDA